MLSDSTNTAIATARKRTSLISTYVPSWSSTRLSLILGVVLGTYPRAASASAVPRKAEPQEDIQQSQAHSSSLDLVLIPPLIMRRNDLNGNNNGKLARRASPFGGGVGPGPIDPKGNNNQGPGPMANGNTHTEQLPATSTAHGDEVPAASSELATITPVVNSPTPTPSQLVSTPLAGLSSLGSTSAPGGASSNQSSGASDGTDIEPSRNGANTAQGPSPLLPTGPVVPNRSYNTLDNDRGYTMTLSVGAGGNYQQQGVNKGLVIGLVISLVILVVFCALAAFLVTRRYRRNRRKQQASPYSDTTPWIASSKKGLVEKAETQGNVESRTSRLQSITSEPRLRARTPGGSSAIPVPYNPSEISDDVSAHFTFLPRDEAIGVPVPYPLAIHIPARVAKAMAERDARWQQSNDLQRQAYLHDRSSSNVTGQTQDDLLTIPDSGSRRSTRRSTATESMMSSSDGAYYTLARRTSTPHSDLVGSRSDAGMGSHIVEGPDRGSNYSSDMLDHSTFVGEIPILPPPLTTRMHGALSSTRLLRRGSATPRLLSVSENPFATNTEVDPFDAAAAAALGKSSDGGTTVGAYQHRRRSERRRESQNTAKPSSEDLGQSIVQNPFDDEPAPEDSRSDRQSNTTAMTEQRSVRDSNLYAGVVEHQTVDGHDPTIFEFPAPPNPTRRPS